MRKLVSKKEESKRQKRNQMILGIILIIVMFGSIFGILVGSLGQQQNREERIIYKGQEFTISNNQYVFRVGENVFYFLSNPRNFLGIESNFNISRLLPSYSGEVLYIDSIDQFSSQTIFQNLNPYMNRIQLACLNEETCPDENLPLKTCEDNMIIIRQAELNRVYEDRNCIIIEGKREDLITLTNEVLLRLIGFN